MTASRIPGPARALGREAWRWTTAVLLAAPLAACNLDVTTPSRLKATDLDNPGSARTLVDGAQADFQCAYGDYVVVSGLISGELADASQTASRWSYDRRVIDPSESQYSQSSCAGLGVYTPLQTARFTNASTLAKLEAWSDADVPDRQLLIAQTAAYTGYTLVLLGEGFCQSPAETNGPALDQQGLFAKAEEYFGTAIAAAQAAGGTAEAKSLLNLAYVGRARARLNQGKKAQAAADAALVPAGFAYTLATFSTADRLENRLYAQNNQGVQITIGASYQKPDSFAVAAAGTRLDGRGNPLWVQQKYLGLDAPYVVASAAEAQLILAEANGTATARQSVSARRQQLFLQGNRLYDIQRFGKADASLVPLDPPSGAAYPKGGKYGDLAGKMCMPLPDIERQNNPNIGV
jgi:starch-binding outer membrane protein, SusD/RagB family